ncbi:MAG TPA: pyruvate kinase [Polyangiaceae bacterium]|nr:pyruvate kinase [Polyangiaceae bacterium]
MPDRRAKIVCTVGPAVADSARVTELVQAGMDVARLNFSHGDPESHAKMAERLRRASADTGRTVAILADLCGPKIRTGTGGPASVEAGETVTLFAGAESTPTELAVGYDHLAEDMAVGDHVLLGDGAIELSVERIADGRVSCKVEHGGALRARMGVNLPAARLRLGAITDKDRSDLRHALEMGVDYLALSFVRSEDDVRELRGLCEALGRPTPIVSKIETPSAVERIEAIVAESDAVMVARGDLGVELPPEVVPIVQREIVGACRLLRKPAIIATEMLQSMTDAPRPTRAEASDVASAIYGGADGVMLSAETATGKYPIRSCQMMDRIIRRAEASRFYDPKASPPGGTTPEAIANSACRIAEEIGAELIVALTESGSTARLVSKARPTVPIIALSPDAKTLRRLSLLWGVIPKNLDVDSDLERLIQSVRQLITAEKWIGSGQRFVLVCGAPVGGRGSTNTVRVELMP